MKKMVKKKIKIYPLGVVVQGVVVLENAPPPLPRLDGTSLLREKAFKDAHAG
jgi:hypothetical protein